MSELFFDKQTHTYQDNFGCLPSVTTILQTLKPFRGNVYDQDGLIWNMQRGTLIHDITTKMDNHLTCEIPESIKGYCDAYSKFVETYKPQWLGIEQSFKHKTLRYAGTIDRFNLDGVFDIKTGSYAEPLQLVAYWMLLIDNSLKIKDNGYFVFLKADGTFRVQIVKNLASQISVWVSCVNVYKYFYSI